MEHDLYRNMCMLKGEFAHEGYDCWRHIFKGRNVKTNEEKTFYVEYYLVNPQRGRNVPVFPKASELLWPSFFMVKAGCLGRDSLELNKYFGVKACENTDTILKISAGDCFLSENNIWGRIKVTDEDVKKYPMWRSDVGNMTWSLRMNKRFTYSMGWPTSWPIRCLHLQDDYWHVEGLKVNYEGTVHLNGEEYEVVLDNCNGYADKHWGSELPKTIIHAECGDLRSKITGETIKDAAFTFSTGLPSLKNGEQRMFIDLCYEGVHFEVNPVKPLSDPQMRYSVYEDEDSVVYLLRGVNRQYVMDFKLKMKKEKMTDLHYYAPNGKKGTPVHIGADGYGEVCLYKKHYGEKILIDRMKVNGAIMAYRVEEELSFE